MTWDWGDDPEAQRYGAELPPKLRAWQGISHHRYAALRMIAALCAVEAPDCLPPKRRQEIVARIHLIARRLAAHGLRLTYDGDHYYVTAQAPPEPPEGEESLRVLGRANTLDDLAAVVARVTGRPGAGDGR